MSQEMKDFVAGVLRNSHTQKINFSYKSEAGAMFRVVANDFSLVAQCIDDGKIDVVDGGAAPDRARYFTRADGWRTANTLYIGANHSARNVFRSLLVHECVHAAFDLKRVVMPWIDNEAIAYIAQGYYVLNAGEDGGLSQQAYLGLEVAKQGANAAVDSFWTDQLRQALRDDPLYKDNDGLMFRGDG
jgi:hypothetical protein